VEGEFPNAQQQTDDYCKGGAEKPEDVVGTIKIINPDRLAGAWTVSFNGALTRQTVADFAKSARVFACLSLLAFHSTACRPGK
jgi:hypothetical protein